MLCGRDQGEPISSFLLFLPEAAAGGGGVHAEGHGARDGPQCQGLQAQQAAVPARGPHHREAGEAAEDRTGAQASAEAPGAPPVPL